MKTPHNTKCSFLRLTSHILKKILKNLTSFSNSNKKFLFSMFSSLFISASLFFALSSETKVVISKQISNASVTSEKTHNSKDNKEEAVDTLISGFDKIIYKLSVLNSLTEKSIKNKITSKIRQKLLEDIQRILVEAFYLYSPNTLNRLDHKFSRLIKDLDTGLVTKDFKTLIYQLQQLLLTFTEDAKSFWKRFLVKFPIASESLELFGKYSRVIVAHLGSLLSETLLILEEVNATLAKLKNDINTLNYTSNDLRKFSNQLKPLLGYDINKHSDF